MRGSKAHTSVEFLLLLLVGIVAVTVLVMASYDQLGSISGFKGQHDARTSLNDISAAAKEVYSQGEGARKQVYINLPSSYEPSGSYVDENAIKLRADGSDYVVVEEFDMHGTLPGEGGSHWVWVISEGNKVRIGNAMLALDPNSIYVMMGWNSSMSTSFKVKNVWDQSVMVHPDITWDNPDLTVLSIMPSSFLMSPGQEYTFSLVFDSGIDSVGFYTGSIAFEATDGNNSETVKLPIIVEVVSHTSAPPLTVIPSLWNVSLMPGDSQSKEFNICVNAETSPSSVTFSTNPGMPGTWLSGMDALGPMASATCRQKTLHLAVPLGTPPGTYESSIQVTGQGVAGAEDTIALIVEVGGNITDFTGPIITNAAHLPNKTYTDEPVTFTITANDTGQGNASIKGCKYSVDFMDWMDMEPADGTFDEEVEEVIGIYMPGFTVGPHIIRFVCIDVYGNVGPESNYTLHVMKNFLFATKVGTPKSHEQDWISWVDLHSSDEDYNWQYDTTDEDHIILDLIDFRYYSVILMADFQFSSDVPPRLTSYVDQGGEIVFLGVALQQGPRDCGLVSSTGTTGSNADVYIIDPGHYITSDYIAGQNVTIFEGHGGGNAMRDDFGGTWLISTDSTQEKIMLGEDGGYIVWGPRTTSSLNEEGKAISRKVLDHALESSTVHPG